MNLVLDRMPAVMPLSIKALGRSTRKPRGDIVLPQISVQLDGVRFDAQNLAEYRAICGFADGAVPIPYPQVNAAALQLHLMTQKQFPLPLVGLVHLKNRIEQQRELSPDERFAVVTGITGQRATDKGLEFDLETTYAAEGGAAVWRGLTTILHRSKQKERRKAPPPAEEAQLSQYHAFEAPEDIGRRYGRISGDRNPIHLYPFTAKLLGFDRHIAHGMWSMARCCALLQPGLGHAPRELATQFRQPLFLPARAALRYGPQGDGIAFSLIGAGSGRTHLAGVLR